MDPPLRVGEQTSDNGTETRDSPYQKARSSRSDGPIFLGFSRTIHWALSRTGCDDVQIVPARRKVSIWSKGRWNLSQVAWKCLSAKGENPLINSDERDVILYFTQLHSQKCSNYLADNWTHLSVPKYCFRIYQWRTVGQELLGTSPLKIICQHSASGNAEINLS